MAGGGRLSRLAKLGSLTSKVTSSYLGSRVRDVFRDEEMRKKAREKLHVDNAREIVRTVGRMKGAAMKLGQQMAVAAKSLDLPDEVADTLGKLHSDAEPVPFTTIREDLEQQLERPLSELFADFDEAPLGTASLGQAHVARLPDGTEVVVKVLHRGVEDTLDADMLALKAVLLSGRVLRRDKQEIEDAFAEIHARLSEELDYLQEAANIQAFHDVIGDDPRLRLPRLHPSLCTERVLVMDRLPGVHLDAFLKTASPEARQRAGVTLAHTYYGCVFRHRMLHADPHPGNYLFEDDGRVGLVDFGCIKRFDEFWVGTYARAAVAAVRGDREVALSAAAELGAWDGTTPGDGDIIWDFCDAVAMGLRGGEITLGAGHEAFLEQMRPVIKRFVLTPSVRVPKDVLFLHRSLAGLYSLARQLEVTADFGEIMLDHAEHAIARAEGRL